MKFENLKESRYRAQGSKQKSKKYISKKMGPAVGELSGRAEAQLSLDRTDVSSRDR